MAGQSGRLERLLAQLGERKLPHVLLKVLRLSVPYFTFDTAHTPCPEQPSVCVSSLQFRPGRRVMLHSRESLRLAEPNIIIYFFS